MFARRAEIFLDSATALWFCSFVIAWFGMGTGADGWSVSRYLLSSAFIALAVLATTAALVGMSARHAGRVDTQTLAIGGLGLLSAAAAGLLAWVVGIWMPLVATAVVWALARTRRDPAMSHGVGVAVCVAAPVLGAGAVATSTVSLIGGDGTEPLIWGLVAGFATVLMVGLVSATIRRSTSRHAAA